MTNTTQTFEPGKVYSLFNASGKIEEVKPVSNLPLYCKVYCYGAGMSERQGAIISGPDSNNTYKVVYISDYEPGFTTLDKYSRPHSKKFGIGIYFDDNGNTWDETTVKEYIAKAEVAVIELKEAERLQSEKDRNEIENLPKLYPHLTVNKGDDKKTTKGNLIAELKKNFPGVKFSVRNEHHSTFNVKWTDGPTTEQVSKITGKFEDHANDWSGDYRDYSPSNFNRVFGGFKYIFENRDQSETVAALLPLAKSILEHYNKIPDFWPDNFLHRIFSAQSFPVGAIPQDIKRHEDKTSANDFSGFFFISYTEPITKEDEKVINDIYSEIGPVSIVDYSDKAIAVIGNTKPIKDTLKALGGRFNPRLTCGAGWVFPKTRYEAVKVSLSL